MKIVVIGGGIAGERIARKLRATLVTENGRFVFPPLLIDAVHGTERTASRPFRAHDVIQGRARVDFDARRVHVGKRSLPYEILVVATGAKAAFPVPGADRHALPFYTMADLTRIRSRLPAERIVVVGAGPTGVELACELAREGKVTLLHNADRVLPGFSDPVRTYAKARLEALGIRVQVDTTVERVEEASVVTSAGAVPFDLCVWCAGVAANLPDGLLGKRGASVDAFLRVDGRPEVFAAGDCAGTGSPLTAQAAIAEADTVVRNVRRQIAGKPLEEHVYRSKGALVKLGSRAALSTPLIKLRGYLPAWLRRAYYTLRLRLL